MSTQAAQDLLAPAMAATEALAELLEREREALAGRDAAVLAELADEKVEVLERLEESGARDLLEYDGDSESVRQAQTQLKDALQRLKDANLRNGEILAHRQQVAQRELDILRGTAQGEAAASTYSRRGTQDDGDSSRRLTTA